ncbi:hypothetical protein [Nocardia caishijiensis]|uniref:UsfY protein n=1 Tax=Nocardia caishijiensis TaxID=184756 RepID=A0ABQ6YM91_9NOCA|nr:hypothetical protein [Nocardia caishijiensis]KAF0846892.1 hypothetical protein FNL39_104314 [Nocardia caishijiensis]
MNDAALPHHHKFPDTERTTRSHVGESIEDAWNWPGLILIGVGVVLLALTLTAAGYGFEGWAVIAAILCVLCLLGGVAIVLAEHRRIKAREGLRLRDPCGH